MVHIRPYQSVDLSAMTRLMSDLGYPASLEAMSVRMERISADPSMSTFVAVIEDRVVGMIGMKLMLFYEGDGNVAQVVTLVVEESCQGQGVGKVLMDYAIHWAEEQNASGIYLNSGNKPERLRAHEFYKSKGFEINGFRFVRKLKG